MATRTGNGAKKQAGAAAAKARVRWSAALPRPQLSPIPYTLSCPELAGYTPGQITRDLIRSDAWAEVMTPLLDEIDYERLSSGREAPLYTSLELESVLVYQRVCGEVTAKAARSLLASDEPQAFEARYLLGFDKARNGGRRRGIKGMPIERLDGVPSESALSRHKKCFGEQRRAEAYECLFERLRDEHMETPELQDEARALAMDGSMIFVRRTAPIIRPETGEVVNAESVTLPDGGFAPLGMGPDKSGHGWNLITLATISGLPLAYTVAKLPGDEKTNGLALIEKQFIPKILPRLPKQSGVLTCDGGFQSPRIRIAARRARLLENIHFSSHCFTSDEEAASVGKRNKRLYAIEGYPNWKANGHREVKCRCGRWCGKRINILGNGSLSVRLEGKCPKCGSITLTSGDWRLAKHPDRFVRCMPNERLEDRDWALGNPLTFNNPEAAAYGKVRFSRNEGFHSLLTKRFRLLEERRWLKNQTEARIDVALVFSILHSISMEQRRRARAVALKIAA